MMRMKKFGQWLLTGPGQAWLLVLLLILTAAARILWWQPAVSVSTLAYSVEGYMDIAGQVVFSSEGRLLLRHGSALLLWDGGEAHLLADSVVNLHLHAGQVWVKTPQSVAQVDFAKRALAVLVEGSSCPEMLPFAGASLVGLTTELVYLVEGNELWVAKTDGTVIGSQLLPGQMKTSFVEHDWYQGLVIPEHTGWTYYRQFEPRARVELPRHQGDLAQVLFLPATDHVLYAVEGQGQTELWWSRPDGSQARRVFSLPARFSSLAALWNDELGMVVLTLLGYEEDAGYADTFHSITLLYHPAAEEMLIMDQYSGQQVRALLPTAWERDKIFFHPLYLEEVRPVLYRLYRKQ